MAKARPLRRKDWLFVIDGELFDDLTGFLCAMGEAANGPGGDFARGRAVCLEGIVRAARGEATLFLHIVETIESARDRAHWMPAPGIVVVLA